MKFRSSLDKYRRGNPGAKKIGQKAAEARAVIDTLSHDGDGIARIDGQAVFVPHTAPGDTVSLKITQRKDRWARAELVEIIEPSASRTTPVCPYVPRCGGCTWQHIRYDDQLKAKQDDVVQTLQRVGQLNDLPIQPIVPSDNPFEYRNRLRGKIRNGRWNFHAHQSGETIEIEQCAIAEPAINDYLAEHDGSLKSTSATSELAVTEDGVRLLPVEDDRTTELGFRQVNSGVSEKLIASVIDIVTRGSDESTLLDLYCGHGTWSVRIARAQPQMTVLGVDVLADNIKAAQQNARGLKNISFKTQSAEKALAGAVNDTDFVIVDPPRAGLSGETTRSLINNPIGHLIYVSCHPATLARDLKLLVEGGYEIERVQAFDMFPQTPHVETLVVLHR